jgi:D-lactate dehydrogenase
MKVAVFSAKSFDRIYFDRFNESGQHLLRYYEAHLNAETTNLCQGFDAVCVFVNDKLDAYTIERLAAQGVRLIALRCAGFNNVDLEATQKHKLTVVRVPAYSPQAVAEHAVALILTLNRKIHKAYNRIREGNFSVEKLTGFDIYGKTVGVVGTGQIGAIFAKIMRGFGCKVLAFDLYPSEDLKNDGVQYVTFEELLQASDIISLHCPLTPQTHHLLSKNEFEKVKPGCMLINTSRGALVNTQAAIDALKHQQLGYLGIDVYEEEEHLFFRDLSESIIHDDVIARLMTFPNVLITAHQGFFTREALEEITTTTLQNLTDFEAGRESGNEVQVQKG